MKSYLLSVLLLFFSTVTIAQSAEDYFPDETGRKWYFRVTPIDSTGELMTELSVIKVDSFAIEANLYGRESKGLLTKTAPQNSVPFLPYLDTLVYSVDGNTVSQFFDFGAYVDTSLIGEPGLIALLNSLRAWYPVFDFDNPVGSDYELFSKDTTITINDQNIPLRLEVDGQREADENISTILGDLTTKKFEISFKLSFLINLPPPLPPIPVRLLTYPNYFWIAENNWIVKEYAPESFVDLSDLGFESFFIPGRDQVLIEQPAYIFVEEPIPGDILFLGDTTIISWRSRNTENVKIEVSADSGNVWRTLYETYPDNIKEAQWLVDGVASEKYFVKVTAIEDTFATSANFLPFEVREKPVLNLTTELAGSELTIGDTVSLTWESEFSDKINIIRVDLATGNSFQIAEEIDSGIGSYDWIVSGVLSDSSIIRIEESLFTRFYAVSGVFSIFELTGVEEKSILPEEFVLNNPYPNPFNPSTTISFGLPENSNVKIVLYNVLGERLEVLTDMEYPAGYHSLRFESKSLPSGIYFVTMQTNNSKFTKKVILAK